MFSISQISSDHSQIVLIALRIMYIIILCTTFHHILLCYISYAYNILIATESNSVELPINLIIIVPNDCVQ